MKTEQYSLFTFFHFPQFVISIHTSLCIFVINKNQMCTSDSNLVANNMSVELINLSAHIYLDFCNRVGRNYEKSSFGRFRI